MGSWEGWLGDEYPLTLGEGRTKGNRQVCGFVGGPPRCRDTLTRLSAPIGRGLWPRADVHDMGRGLRRDIRCVDNLS